MMGVGECADSDGFEISRNLKVAVLTGGVSRERDVSLESGSCVAQALRDAGLQVVTSDIRPDNLGILQDDSIDVFFIALHGEFGEDGRLQQILENRQLIYTGSGPEASRRAFDKMAGKRAFTEAGVATPAAIEFAADADGRDLEKQLKNFAGSYVVKPLRQGSTIGVSIVDEAAAAIKAAHRCREEFGDCMVEQYIAGRELSVGILGERSLPVIEIRAAGGFYDYHAKYKDDNTEYLFDTIDGEKLAADIHTAALACFNALRCRHFGRVDFILGGDGVPYALEVNTVPGLTGHSLLPMAAAKIGLSMSGLCLEVVKMAMKDQRPEQMVKPAVDDRE